MLTAISTTSAHVEAGSNIDPSVRFGAFVSIGVQPDGASVPLPDVVIGAHGLIRSHTVIYAGNRMGQNFQTGHGVLIRENNRIGDDVSIGSHSVVEHHIEIGNRVRIHSNAFVPEYSVLEDDVWVGPGAVLTNAKYPATPNAKKALVGPHLGRGCVIGAAAVLLPGVRIGRNAVVGAGAVVTKNVADGVVVYGQPAKPCPQATERFSCARRTS
jgi:acetyltransferase-like isoleucine patch superfamily enzyme